MILPDGGVHQRTLDSDAVEFNTLIALNFFNKIQAKIKNVN